MNTKITPALSVYLDLMRFCAAVVVVLHHVWHIVFPAFPLPWPGHSAVVVFFVLSGFVISHTVDKPGVTLHHYVTHRLLRIMPVTLIALLLSVALAAYAGTADLRGDGTPALGTGEFWRAIVLNATFLGQSWMTVTPAYNLPFWSLSYEVWYYVIFGVWVFSPQRYRLAASIVAAMLAGPKILLLFPVWLLGVALYKSTYRPQPGLSRAIFAVTTVLALLFIWLDLAVEIRKLMEARWPVTMSYTDGAGQFVGDFMLGLLVAGNFLAVYGMSNDFRFLLKFTPLVKYLSSFTFSIYLFHMPLFVFLWYGLGIRASMLIFAGLAAGIYCFGQLSERRTAFFRGLIAQRQPAPAPVVKPA